MTEQEVSCPKCGGRMWDNRISKKNPAAPDFKCRDRSCDGVVWPPKASRGGNGARAASAPSVANATRSAPHGASAGFPYDIGRTGIEELDEDTRFADDAVQAIQQGANKTEKLNALFQLYDVCFSHALTVAKKAGISDPSAVAAMAATLYIQANQRGLAA